MDMGANRFPQEHVNKMVAVLQNHPAGQLAVFGLLVGVDDAGIWIRDPKVTDGKSVMSFKEFLPKATVMDMLVHWERLTLISVMGEGGSIPPDDELTKLLAGLKPLNFPGNPRRG